MADPPPWHPVMLAVEGPTAVWRMVDASGVEFGRIELRRIMNGADVRYRAEHRGEVIGWATSLATAAERVHRAHLATLGRPGPPRADWGGRPARRR